MSFIPASSSLFNNSGSIFAGSTEPALKAGTSSVVIEEQFAN